MQKRRDETARMEYAEVYHVNLAILDDLLGRKSVGVSLHYQMFEYYLNSCGLSEL